MSHFTVLVIGDDVEKQLQPFHEFECTGENDQYVQDVDITEEFILNGTDSETGNFDLEEALSYYGFEDSIVEDESAVDRDGGHKYGYAVVKEGKVIKAVDRTNPNKKWDWWQIGGRWTGLFKVKNGADYAVGRPGLLTQTAKEGYADSLKKSDIDFDAMRTEAYEKAAELYDAVHSIIDGKTDNFIPWNKMRDDIHKGNIDAARKAYHDQDAVKALRSNKDFAFKNVEDFTISRDKYIENAKNSAISTFAVLKDGQWYERGQMGWWGMVSDEKDQTAWDSEFSKLIDSVPEDTLLSVVDCHI